ncbi:hypothetical protein KBY57_09995 [Cyanobium sp. Aljojuca 7D2]|uniref:hypothetical protein n=1 Tax=Cyanobium sp. Aljojuca 7D2 TaxID=2823698 RepID=UPI0020CE7947|nr:hypothetical protein [Cyanobium sp. Aljojuca 7D2]MCP9891382.1 hypothetical protein [Cyanobium sp. Aljojuca 7D2]
MSDLPCDQGCSQHTHPTLRMRGAHDALGVALIHRQHQLDARAPSSSKNTANLGIKAGSSW